MTPPVTTALLYDRAAIIPGRTSTRSKAPDLIMPLWTTGQAAGAILYDSEGNAYIDMKCGLGAISLGYGLSFGHGVYSMPHAIEVQAAELVLEHVAPWASAVRFVKTGSEATHAAYRIAKRATGRQLVAMGSSSYHGWHEWCSEGSTTRLLYPRESRFAEIDGDALAAIFVEPPRFEIEHGLWLRWLREYCTQHGILLVFDEMIYGGRWALGGLTDVVGIEPDLACYGKAFGNGEAVAFVVGNEALAEYGEIVSGTFSGDVTGLSALVETLHVYTTQPVIQTMWERGEQLGQGLAQVIPASFATIDGAEPLQRIQFVNPDQKMPFARAMWKRGVYTHPDWFMTCFSHTPEQIDQVVDAAAVSVRSLL